MTKNPILGNTSMEFIKTGQRQKGDPLDVETFAAVKKALARRDVDGYTLKYIGEQHKISAYTTRLIGQSKDWAHYKELRTSKSNWHANQKAKRLKPAKRGFWSRLFGDFL